MSNSNASSDNNNNSSSPPPIAPPSTPTRPIADERQFSICSRNAAVYINGSMKSAVQFSIPDFHVINKSVNYITMRITDATFPNFFYNLFSPTLSFSLSVNNQPATYFSLSFNSGCYNIYQCIQALNTAVKKYDMPVQGVWLSQVMYFSYNKELNQVSIVTNAMPLSIRPVLTLYSTDLSTQLGFDIPDDGLLIYLLNNQDTAATYPPDLSGVTHLFVQAIELAPLNYATELTSRYILKYPITGNLQTKTTYQYQNSAAFMIQPTSLHNILTLNIVDQNGNLVDFKGYDWDFTFILSYYRTDIQPIQDLFDTLNAFVADQQASQQAAAQSQQDQDAAALDAQQTLNLNPQINVPNPLTPEQYQQLVILEFPPELKDFFKGLEPALDPLFETDQPQPIAYEPAPENTNNAF